MTLIDRQSPVPLYLQLEELIRSQIASGVLRPGDPLPAEAELQARFSVSRTTVRQAMANLERDGMISRVQGKGTFISRPRKSQPRLSLLSSFSEEIKRGGRTPGAHVVQLAEIPCPADISDRLGVDEGQPLVLYERVRTVDDKPVGLHTVYLNRQVLQSLPLDRLRADNISLYEIVEKECGLKIGFADEALEAIAADEPLARVLGIPMGFPVVFIERTTFTASEVPFEYCKMYVRGDEFRYRARLRRDEG